MPRAHTRTPVWESAAAERALEPINARAELLSRGLIWKAEEHHIAFSMGLDSNQIPTHAFCSASPRVHETITRALTFEIWWVINAQYIYQENASARKTRTRNLRLRRQIVLIESRLFLLILGFRKICIFPELALISYIIFNVIYQVAYAWSCHVLIVKGRDIL